jgi:hypothetical protein
MMQPKTHVWKPNLQIRSNQIKVPLENPDSVKSVVGTMWCNQKGNHENHPSLQDQIKLTVSLWCTDILISKEAFLLFNLGGFTLFLLFNRSGRASVPITPSYFSLTRLEMSFAEAGIWLDRLQPRYTKPANKRSTKSCPIPHETHLLGNLLVWIALVTFCHNFYPSKSLSRIQSQKP